MSGAAGLSAAKRRRASGSFNEAPRQKPNTERTNPIDNMPATAKVLLVHQERIRQLYDSATHMTDVVNRMQDHFKVFETEIISLKTEVSELKAQLSSNNVDTSNTSEIAKEVSETVKAEVDTSNAKKGKRGKNGRGKNQISFDISD